MRLAILLLSLFLAFPALAVDPGERLDDPALEARAREISREVRCMVCQNQSIDDSDADLAGDLRILIRERLTAGDSDAEVYDFLVARYGDFVLLRPRLGASTLVLWFAGPAILLVGVAALFIVYRRRGRLPPVPPLDAEEQARLRDLSGDLTKV
jgi:cytochrome c-type biogenesis protein CcmH